MFIYDAAVHLENIAYFGRKIVLYVVCFHECSCAGIVLSVGVDINVQVNELVSTRLH